MTSISPYSTSNIILFTPDQISGLALWLDAADSSTIQLSGANVTQWNDKSRNGYNCISNSNYAGTSLPTYSNLANPKYVNFAPNQALVTSNNWNYSSAWSCFVALNSVVLGARWLISPHNSSPTPVFMGMNQGINKIFQNAFASVPADITGQHIEYTSAENTSAVSNLLWYRDGTLQASNVKNLGGINSSTPLKMGIGANGTVNNSMAGTYQLYEVIIYNKYLSALERQQVESYLGYKWNLQRNLPTTHPYSRIPYNAYYGLVISNNNIINKSENIQPLPVTIPNNIQPYNISPRQYTGCVLWLDALDSSTVGLSGVNITSLRDKSANAYLFSNSTGFTYNVNKFNGTYPSFFSSSATSARHLGSNVSVNFTQPLTVFVVCSKLTDANNAYLFDGINITNRIAYYSARGNVFAGSQIGSGSNIISSPCVITVNYNTTNSITLLNGTQYSSGNVGTGSLATGLTLGSRYTVTESWDGHICEMIFYNSILTEKQRQQIEGYLAWKWGIQRSLATNHRFYNFPPG